MTGVGKRAWSEFAVIVKGFLGNKNAANCKDLVETLPNSFQTLGCNMSMKVHFLKSHLSEFPANLRDVSDKHGEVMEVRCQGDGRHIWWLITVGAFKETV